MQKVYADQINEFEYYDRGDGMADVYIRKNIAVHMENDPETGEEFERGLEADEVHLITEVGREEIEEHLEEWWEYGLRYQPEPEDLMEKLNQALSKVKDLEDIILEMSEEIYA